MENEILLSIKKNGLFIHDKMKKSQNHFTMKKPERKDDMLYDSITYYPDHWLSGDGLGGKHGLKKGAINHLEMKEMFCTLMWWSFIGHKSHRVLYFKYKVFISNQLFLNKVFKK